MIANGYLASLMQASQVGLLTAHCATASPLPE